MIRKDFTDFAQTLLKKHYSQPTDTCIDDIFKRAINNFSYGDFELADRLQFYIDNKWFNFSSPPLSNSIDGEWVELENPTDWKTHEFKTIHAVKSMPISCFIQAIPDSLIGQIEAAEELSWLSVSGGGVGQAIQIRGITEKSPGAIPYLKTVDSNIMYYRQGSTRRGSVASYLNVSHPDIIEFLGIRNPTGGDINRKCHNINIGVNITDEFINAIDNDLDWELKCPKTNEVTATHKARDIWQEIIETRFKTGEPYIHYISESNRRYKEFLGTNKYYISSSNLCTEIISHCDEENTVVCCLSSLNLEYYDEWKDTRIVEDLIVLLDNVLEWFITYAPKELWKAVNFAKGFRDLGIGTMGWHYYLQKNNIPFESGGIGSAAQLTNTIFKSIKEKALAQSVELAKLRGEPEYLKGLGRRNAQLLAPAPNANSSILFDTTPSNEPAASNIFTHRTRVGSHIIKNKYLNKLLINKSKEFENPEEWVNEQWKIIIADDGSVQDLDCLTDLEKKVYLTAYEIDQRFVIDQARIRQIYVCQSQSVNVFFNAGVNKKIVNDVHRRAFSRNPELPGTPMKSLYYCRTSKEAKIEKVSGSIVRNKLTDYETQATVAETECLSCQG